MLHAHGVLNLLERVQGLLLPLVDLVHYGHDHVHEDREVEGVGDVLHRIKVPVECDAIHIFTSTGSERTHAALLQRWDEAPVAERDEEDNHPVLDPAAQGASVAAQPFCAHEKQLADKEP
jgi:hypothetical protein